MKKATGITTALVAGALLAPAAAQAHPETAVSSVKAHTAHADAALGRAVALYPRRGAPADRALVRSRRELAAATREAAKLRRQADNQAEELQAARAVDLVATEQDENVEKLTAALDDAPARWERRVAAAALADTRGREHALDVLTAVLGKVPEQARRGIARAIARLSDGRDQELRAQVQALTDGEVTTVSKRAVARTLTANVEGQVEAAERLAALIAGEQVPEEAKPGLRQAHAAVSAQHRAAGDRLSRSFNRMPPAIRSLMEEVVQQAREDAAAIRANPLPPASAQPSDAPAGQPSSTPAGQPSSTTTSQPSSTPAGQPSDTPAEPPSSTTTSRP